MSHQQSFSYVGTGLGTLANSEDRDEMPHNVAFHQCLHCLLLQNQSLEKEIPYFWKS